MLEHHTPASETASRAAQPRLPTPRAERAEPSPTGDATAMDSASPIVPWIGGKRRLAERLLPLFPPHE